MSLTDGETREWWTVHTGNMPGVVHHKALYIERASWVEMFPSDPSLPGAPFSREWMLFDETDYWADWRSQDGSITRTHTHYWNFHGRATVDPNDWPDDRVRHTSYADACAELRRLLGESISRLEKQIAEARRALDDAGREHECLPLPVER